MSAFGDAVGFVVDVSGYSPAPLEPEEAAATLRPFFDAFAHELAEKIRRELPNTPCTDDYEFVRTAAEAADLIDPEATT